MQKWESAMRLRGEGGGGVVTYKHNQVIEEWMMKLMIQDHLSIGTLINYTPTQVIGLSLKIKNNLNSYQYDRQPQKQVHLHVTITFMNFMLQLITWQYGNVELLLFA